MYSTTAVRGAFPGFEASIDSRFEADGVTPIGRPTIVEHVVGDLQTAGSSIWDLGYDHRLGPRWALHVSVLDRHGDNQLILNPVSATGTSTAGIEQLVLSSDGRSNYLQEEVDVHIIGGTRMDLLTSYVHSQARENLNTFVNFYGSILDPIVGEDQYAPAASDAPNRLFLRGQAMPTARWRSARSTSAAVCLLGRERRSPSSARVTGGAFPPTSAPGRFRRRVSPCTPGWAPRRQSLGAFLPTDTGDLRSPNFGSFYNSECASSHSHAVRE